MLNPRISTLLGLVPKPWPGAPPGGKLNYTIQVPHTRVTRIETTVTIPDGQVALYRVRPVRQPAAAATQPADALDRPTLLMVKPTVISPAPPDQKLFPLLSTHATSRTAAPARPRDWPCPACA